MTSLVTNTWGSIIWIKSMDMESLLGSLEMFTKETTIKMSEKAMGKCTSQMAPFTKGPGQEASKQEDPK